MLRRVDLGRTLLDGALSFLLFAGALGVRWKELRQQRWAVLLLATVGVLISTFLVAGMAHLLFGWLGLQVPFLACLLFGALISPTDPIAVLGLLKQAKAPASLSTKIAGESLFNDGIGVVIFLVFYELWTAQGPAGGELDWPHVGALLLREAGGGLALGLLLGWVTYRLLKSVDDYQVEVLLTLALVSGGYEVAKLLHTSGPLAIVVAGIVIGNPGRQFAMSERTREHLDTFWELVDEILNALLFVLLGLEVLVLRLQPGYLAAAALAIPLVLLARLVSVAGAGGAAAARPPTRRVAERRAADLGRAARGHLHRAGPGIAAGAGARSPAGGDLRRRGLFHPGAGADDALAVAARASGVRGEVRLSKGRGTPEPGAALPGLTTCRGRTPPRRPGAPGSGCHRRPPAGPGR